MYAIRSYYVQFIFRDENNNELFDDQDAIFMVFGDSSGKRAESWTEARISWSITLKKDTTLSEEDQIAPEEGDVYRLVTKKPFRTGEYYEFIRNNFV